MVAPHTTPRTARQRGVTMMETTLATAVLAGTMALGVPLLQSVGNAGDEGSARVTTQADNLEALTRIASELQNTSTTAQDELGNFRFQILNGDAPDAIVDARSGDLGGFRGILGTHEDPTNDPGPGGALDLALSWGDLGRLVNAAPQVLTPEEQALVDAVFDWYSTGSTTFTIDADAGSILIDGFVEVRQPYMGGVVLEGTNTDMSSSNGSEFSVEGTGTAVVETNGNQTLQGTFTLSGTIMSTAIATAGVSAPAPAPEPEPEPAPTPTGGDWDGGFGTGNPPAPFGGGGGGSVGGGSTSGGGGEVVGSGQGLFGEGNGMTIGGGAARGSGSRGGTRIGRERSASLAGATLTNSPALRARRKSIPLNHILRFQKVIDFGVDTTTGMPAIVWSTPIEFRIANRKLTRTQDGETRVVAPNAIAFTAELTDAGTLTLTLVSQKRVSSTGRVAFRANQIEVAPKN